MCKIIHTSFCISKIICFEIGVFCKIFDGQLVPLPWKQKIINILSFFLFIAFVNQILVI